MKALLWTMTSLTLFACASSAPVPAELPAGTPDAASVVRWALDGGRPDQRGDAAWLARILRDYPAYPPPYVDEVLDQLVVAAAAGGDRGLEALKRLGHFSFVPRTMGREEWVPQVYYPGVVERLATVHSLADREARRWVVTYFIRGQADRVAAVGFLERVAAESVGYYDPNEPMLGSWAGDALESLLNCGPEGREALRRLHAAGDAVSDPNLRRSLERLSKTGFKRP